MCDKRNKYRYILAHGFSIAGNELNDIHLIYWINYANHRRRHQLVTGYWFILIRCILLLFQETSTGGFNSIYDNR